MRFVEKHRIFYGAKSVTLRVSENRVLSRMFGPKGDEVTGEWRKLHTDELNDLYSHQVSFG